MVMSFTLVHVNAIRCETHQPVCFHPSSEPLDLAHPLHATVSCVLHHCVSCILLPRETNSPVRPYQPSASIDGRLFRKIMLVHTYVLPRHSIHTLCICTHLSGGNLYSHSPRVMCAQRGGGRYPPKQAIPAALPHDALPKPLLIHTVHLCPLVWRQPKLSLATCDVCRTGQRSV